MTVVPRAAANAPLRVSLAWRNRGGAGLRRRLFGSRLQVNVRRRGRVQRIIRKAVLDGPCMLGFIELPGVGRRSACRNSACCWGATACSSSHSAPLAKSSSESLCAVGRCARSIGRGAGHRTIQRWSRRDSSSVGRWHSRRGHSGRDRHGRWRRHGRRALSTACRSSRCHHGRRSRCHDRRSQVVGRHDGHRRRVHQSVRGVRHVLRLLNHGRHRRYGLVSGQTDRKLVTG